MDTLFLGSGTSVFAFLGESKLNLIAGIVLLAVALWSLVATITAFCAPPKRRSVRFGFFTALNVVFSVAGIVYSAVVALEKTGVIAVASAVLTDNAFLAAVVDLIALGADRDVFGYALYAVTVLSVIAFVVTLVRARRAQFINPVAKAKDDGYVLVDDGESPEIADEQPETPQKESETNENVGEITDDVTTEEFTEEPEVRAATEETYSQEPTVSEEETEPEEEVPTGSWQAGAESESAPETEETNKPDKEETAPVEEEADKRETEQAEEDDDDEPAVPISVARKRIADMGNVLGKLDDLFDNSAFDPIEEKEPQERKNPIANKTVPEKIEEEKITEPIEEEKTDLSDPDSVENILGRILASTREKVKPAPSVAKPVEKKVAPKPQKAVKVESEPAPVIAAQVSPGDEKAALTPNEKPIEAEKIVVDEKVREDAEIAKTERKRAGRVRTIGRAAELFDEYLSAQSEEDKKKITQSIDCIVVDKDKK